MHLPKKIAICTLLLILAGLFYLEYASRFFDFALGAKKNQLSIAVVADLSGPSAFTGQSTLTFNFLSMTLIVVVVLTVSE